ncbi:hypothetical protein FRB99_000135 [Tulasnella sp. 403]|nr:hypothetical protein FRB99_000135 [Tulasnella sp. 403]
MSRAENPDNASPQGRRRRFRRVAQVGKVALQAAEPVIRICHAAKIPFAEPVLGIVLINVDMIRRARKNRREACDLLDAAAAREEMLEDCSRQEMPGSNSPNLRISEDLASFRRGSSESRRKLDHIVNKSLPMRVLSHERDADNITRCRRQLQRLNVEMSFRTDQEILANTTAVMNVLLPRSEDRWGILGMRQLPNSTVLNHSHRVNPAPNDTEFWKHMEFVSVDGRDCLVTSYTRRAGGHEAFKRDMNLLRQATGSLFTLAWGFNEDVSVPYIAYHAKTVEELCEELCKMPTTHPWRVYGEQAELPPVYRTCAPARSIKGFDGSSDPYLAFPGSVY